VIQHSVLLKLTQRPCADVRLKSTQIVQNRLISSGVRAVEAVSKMSVLMLIAKFALSHGLMIHLTSILQIKTLMQCVDVSRKDKLLLITSMAMVAAA